MNVDKKPIGGVNKLRGEGGGEYISDAVAHTGQWFSLVVITDTTIAAITQPNFDNSDALVGVSLAPGTVIFGKTTAITLASGIVQALKY